ncbi:hypothetical protein P8T57_14535 [Thalassospira sp. SN3W]|uniref:hypothetical protein n=1 Tax=Thalassospira sp. SN3W TaxID=3035476 RepID=UPI00311B1B98
MGYRRFILAPLIMSAVALSLPFDVEAAETKQIARSSKLGIELFGVGGDNWCKADAHLKLARNADSPLVDKEETLFPTIAKVFDAECPQMEVARVEVTDSAGTLTRDFRIAKASGWAIAPEAAVGDPAQKTAEDVTPKDDVAKEITEVPEAPPAPTVAKQEKPVVVEKKQPDVKPVSLTAENVFWLAAKYYPEALNDDRVIDQFASLESCDDYRGVWKNEFDLRDWRKKVKPEVIAKSDSASNLFEFSFTFDVRRQYDFETSMLDIGGFIPSERQYEVRCFYGSGDFDDNAIGGRVHVSFEGLPDSFNQKIYLPGDLGRSAVDRLQAVGNRVRITYLAQLSGVGLKTGWPKHYELKAEFIDVKIFTGEQLDYLLVHHDEAKFIAAREQHMAAVRKAAEEQRRAEEQRLAAQRSHEEELRRVQQEREDAQAQKLYDSLAGDGVVPAKLAALHHDGNPSFDNPYDIAATAFSRGRKFPVRAFVEVGERDSVGYRAKWPSRVYLTGEGLEEGDWYFVSGMGDGQKIDGALYSVISVDKATKCDGRICMNKEDVAAYVRSQYPQWSGARE